MRASARESAQRAGGARCARAPPPSILGYYSSHILPWARPPSDRAGAASVASLSTLAAGFGGKLGMLGKTALLIGYALTALASGNRSQLAILREAALRTRYALTALAPCFNRESAVLRETPFLVGHCLAAHAGNLSLPLGVHRGKTTM